jgi:hypothetical protein
VGAWRSADHFIIYPYSEKRGTDETDKSGKEYVCEVFFGKDEGYDEADECVDDYEWHGV